MCEKVFWGLVSLFNWNMVANSLEKFSVDHHNTNILHIFLIITPETFPKTISPKIFLFPSRLSIFFLRFI